MLKDRGNCPTRKGLHRSLGKVMPTVTSQVALAEPRPRLRMRRQASSGQESCGKLPAVVGAQMGLSALVQDHHGKCALCPPPGLQLWIKMWNRTESGHPRKPPTDDPRRPARLSNFSSQGP